jgi:hypothetical protein
LKKPAAVTTPPARYDELDEFFKDEEAMDDDGEYMPPTVMATKPTDGRRRARSEVSATSMSAPVTVITSDEEKSDDSGYSKTPPRSVSNSLSCRVVIEIRELR